MSLVHDSHAVAVNTDTMTAAPRQVTTASTGNFPQQMMTPSGKTIATSTGNIPQQMMTPSGQIITLAPGNILQQMMTPSGQVNVTSTSCFPEQMMTPSGQVNVTSTSCFPEQMMTPSGQTITLAPGNILQQMMTPSGQVNATSTSCFPEQMRTPSEQVTAASIGCFPQQMMTPSRQIIATSSGNFTRKMISVSGKSETIANQSDLMPIHADQALMQYGIVANQQSVSSPKAVTSSQKEKMHMFQNQLIPLQPNTVYVSNMPVQSSTQRFNGNNVIEISPQPQVITTQASGTMLNQVQLLGIQAISPLPPDIPSTHFRPNRNPFIIYDQQAGMAAQQFQPQMAMHLPVDTAMLPFTATPATVAAKKQILHKLISKKKNVIRNILASPSPSNLSTATVSSQMNQVPSIPMAQQMTTNNHIYHNPVQFYHDKTKSTRIENKAVSKISTTQKSQTTVAPFPQILQTSSSTTTIITAVPVTYYILPFGSSTVASSSTNTQTAVTYARMNQAISIPIKQRSNASSQTDQIPVQGINYQRTNGIGSKPVSIETKISSTQESQTAVTPFSRILQTSISRTSLTASVASSTLKIESSTDVSTSPSNIQTVTAHTQMNQVSSTSVAPEKSKATDQICPNLVQIVNDKIKSDIESKSVYVETPQKLQTMIAPFTNTLQACVISTIDAVSVASSAPTTASSTMSVMVGSSVQMDTSFSTIDTITSSISTIPPVPCLTNKKVSDFNLQSLSKSHNAAIGISHQIKTIQTVMTTEHVKSRQAMQEPSLKQPQKAIVKPRILTHVINGIVIQEGLEPFPVSKPPLLDLPYNTSLPAKKLESPKEKEDSAMGNRGRKRKKFRGRRYKQIESLIEEENTKTSIALETTSIPENGTTVCCNTNEDNSALLSHSPHQIPTEEDESNNEVGVETTSIPENETEVCCNTKEDNSIPPLDGPYQFPMEEDESNKEVGVETTSVSVNETTVCYNTEEDNSVPPLDGLYQYQQEEDESNNEVGMPKTDLSQKLPSEWTSPVEDENTKASISLETTSIPENETTVCRNTKEDNSVPPSDSLYQFPIKEHESNNEVRVAKTDLSQKLPSKWTVQEVFEFVQNFPDCSEYADNFKSQEIDGQVLLLLNEYHLRTDLCMKLGPALKMLSQIRRIEESCLTLFKSQ